MDDLILLTLEKLSNERSIDSDMSRGEADDIEDRGAGSPGSAFAQLKTIRVSQNLLRGTELCQSAVLGHLVIGGIAQQVAHRFL